MTKIQENTLSMFTPVESVLITHNAVWHTLPAFVSAHDAFLTAWAAIDPDAQKQVTGSTGVTAGKAAQQAELIRLTLLVSGNIYAWALATGDARTRTEMDFPRSTLEHQRDNVLLVTARLVYDTAQANGPALQPYGLSPALLSEFQAAITAFNSGSGAPRATISIRKTATQTIRENLKICMTQLEIMDRLIANFRSAEPGFVSEYFNARILVDLGHRSNPPA